jgi:hypothetical protein
LVWVEQGGVGVGRAAGWVFEPLADALLDDICIGDAVDDTELGAGLKAFEGGLPDSILEGGFSHEGDPVTNQQIENREEGGVCLRREWIVRARYKPGERMRHPLLELISANRGTRYGLGERMGQRGFPHARLAADDDEGW